MKLLLVAVLVAGALAHTWQQIPEGRTGAGAGGQSWDPDAGPCSSYANSNDPSLNALNPRVVAGVDSGAPLRVSWFPEHSPAQLPPCSDQSQYMIYRFLENPESPDVSTAVEFGAGCTRDGEFTADVPDLPTGTYTLQMTWKYDYQQGSRPAPPVFYSCADVDVEGRSDNENIDASNTIAGRVLSVLPYLAPLGIIPAAIACALARRHKRESVRLTRMTQMSGTGSMYADVDADRNIGNASGTTRASGVSVLTADGNNPTLSMSSAGNRATGITDMTKMTSSRGSRGSGGRRSSGKRSSGKRSSGGRHSSGGRSRGSSGGRSRGSSGR